MKNIAEKRSIVTSNLGVAPVQTVALARQLGLEVYHTDSWPDDISGMILKSEEFGGNSGYAIYVNGKHHVNRRRFTTAHEIAHFVLHENLIGDGITDDALYRSELSGPIEAQANRYAADILMPWSLINEAMSSGHRSVEDLADHLQVSKSAMSIRLGVPYEKH
jgi:hypothetical protein